MTSKKKNNKKYFDIKMINNGIDSNLLDFAINTLQSMPLFSYKLHYI